MIKVDNFQKMLFLLACFFIVSFISFVYCPWENCIDNILIYDNDIFFKLFKFLFFGVYDLLSLVFYLPYNSNFECVWGFCIYVLALFGWMSIISEKVFKPSMDSKFLNLLLSYVLDNIMSYIMSIVGLFLSPVIVFLYSKIMDMEFYSIIFFVLLVVISIPAGTKLFNCFLYFGMITLSLILYTKIYKVLSFNIVLANIISIAILFICVILTCFANNLMDSFCFENFFKAENEQDIEQIIYSALYTSILISFAFIFQIVFLANAEEDISCKDLNVNISSKILNDGYIMFDILLENPNDYAITIDNKDFVYNTMYLKSVDSNSSSESDTIASNGTLEYQIVFKQTINFDFYVILSIIVIISYIIYVITIAHFNMKSIAIVIVFNILMVASGNYALLHQNEVYFNYVENRVVIVNGCSCDFSYRVNIRNATDEETIDADNSKLLNSSFIDDKVDSNIDMYEWLETTSNNLFETLKYVFKKVIAFFVTVLLVVGCIVERFKSKGDNE